MLSNEDSQKQTPQWNLPKEPLFERNNNSQKLQCNSSTNSLSDFEIFPLVFYLQLAIRFFENN